MDTLQGRALWSTAPPEPRSRASNNPTLLFSWWCTCFSMAIILTRVCGRKVRSNVLFREDWIMLLASIPLFARMACIHVVLLYGTNNIQTEGHTFTELQIYHHSIGARLVLAARIFYAAFIWVSKWTVSEFLKRITKRTWRRSYEITLLFIRGFLVVTFIGVVIATVSECQPFDHYWQVIPDPGPRCRQGFAQLLTMGVCDIITDILLVIFPIPIILTSGATWKRKVQLFFLFSLSLVMIAVTAIRMPEVISHRGRQQYRTVWASCEILASTATSNAVSLGSFLRDKGTKRNKFRAASQVDSMERSSVRRPTLATIHPTSSDEHLFHSLGCRVPEHLQEKHELTARPAPPAFSNVVSPFNASTDAKAKRDTTGPPRESSESDSSSARSPMDTFNPEVPPLPSHEPATAFSFFDIGGLLTPSTPSQREPGEAIQTNYAHGHASSSGVTTQDFASRFAGLPDSIPSRPNSRAHFGQLGVIPSPSVSRSSHGSNVFPSHARAAGDHDTHQDRLSMHSARSNAHVRAPIGVLGPMLERRDTLQSLQDAGGLLEPNEMIPIISAPNQQRMNNNRALTPSHPAGATTYNMGGLHDHNHTMTSGSLSPRRLISPRSTNRAVAPPHNADIDVPAQNLVLHDAGGLASP